MKRAKPRAAVVLLQDDKIALLERNRRGTRYFVFPGGGVDKGETAEQAAIREADEELGVQITVSRLVAELWYDGMPQYYYLAELISGDFGSGHGKEMSSAANSGQGSYRPCWIPIAELTTLPVLPSILARYILKAFREGWPEAPLCQRDATPD
jgi:8-oxo-dGTP pyrophosphatase MutT (NUDIX family)